MTHIVAISGSLRRASFNTHLLRAATSLMPEGASIDIRTINDIPLYNADDEEAKGLPSSVDALKNAIKEADGVLLATPEYNNGIPGVFKNTIDWLSRPAADIPHIFGGKRIAVIGASPGGFGTLLAQDAWLSVLRTLGTEPWFGGRLLVSHAGDAFDAEGNIINETMAKRYQDFLAGFVNYVRS